MSSPAAVVIDPSDSVAVALRPLAAGETIKQTQSAVVLESLISQFLFNKAADAGATPAPAAPANGGKK